MRIDVGFYLESEGIRDRYCYESATKAIQDQLLLKNASDHFCSNYLPAVNCASEDQGSIWGIGPETICPPHRSSRELDRLRFLETPAPASALFL